ncbi:MAG: VanZ family protein [Balneolales bacterium]|nr:VanZ family protein [Balneolales bacterium]
MKLHEFLKQISPVLPLLLFGWMILAMYLTLFPGDMLVSAARWGNPKLGHVILFGGWTFLFGMNMMVFFNKPRFPVFLMILIGIIFGAIVELMQFAMPYGRSGMVSDIGYNAVGASLAGLMLWFYRSKFIPAESLNPKKTDSN